MGHPETEEENPPWRAELPVQAMTGLSCWEAAMAIAAMAMAALGSSREQFGSL